MSTTFRTKCRVVTIIDPLTGRTSSAIARTFRQLPRSRYREVPAELNTKPYTFRCTCGTGRGEAAKHYAYAVIDDDVWTIDTGDDDLPFGANVHF
ncbi:hypothetical protein [Cupriavidus taiwanensis]|uniref:hypothetical protein n=1 Tax=Cupriavidus taiwanensis TaxID=164546 RepID=UPI000E1544FD|nr:hypothetical protein [Cupriavidus taiwanensis]SPA17240.1 hypothetical protein CBM2631_A90316 [Cupriavidus taiwanensis]